jgi:hypothetical protein
MGCLYQLISPSGKSYIGITMKTVGERFEWHRKDAKHKGRDHKALYRAFAKYGPENFQLRELVRANDWLYLCLLEKKVISAFGTKSPLGYNLTDGGDGVAGMCEETAERHRENTRVGTKIAWDRVDHKQAQSVARSDPEYKKRQADKTRASKLWERPEYREKTLAAHRDPNVRASISRSVSALWEDPTYRESQMAKRRMRAPRSAESKKAQGDKMRAIIAERKANGTYWLTRK